jgi:hypothetical protein
MVAFDLENWGQNQVAGTSSTFGPMASNPNQSAGPVQFEQSEGLIENKELENDIRDFDE